jgi:hypothetical protein
MSDCYVVMYSLHQSNYSYDSVAAVCSSLDRAQTWLVMERLGKPWTELSHIEGEGLSMRIITNFNEADWSAYYIRKYHMED